MMYNYGFPFLQQLGNYQQPANATTTTAIDSTNNDNNPDSASPASTSFLLYSFKKMLIENI